MLPNSSARPVATGFWEPRYRGYPAHSAIVVPRDATPFNSLVLTERIVTIFRDLQSRRLRLSLSLVADQLPLILPHSR